MWLIAATMLGDNCHGDDAREICTAHGQHWALTLPFIALIYSVVAAVMPVVLIAAFRWRAQWALVGLPLSIAAYFVGPLVANWAHSAGTL